jgi:DNA repair exonuclease SbcCD ATPase subunit
MKGRSFDTFELIPGNREAYDVCRRVATLEEMGPSLVLLLGPEGCGKSHLLWSIAKQVRLSAIPVGLALVTPGDFPDKVKMLVEDPRPLQGRRAMLLVDNLEGFDEDARRLEAVIEAFLAHQHPVIVASNVQTNRLQKLSGPLRARLARSRSVLLEARTAGAVPWQAAEQAAELEEANQALQWEKNSLQTRFDALQQERDGLLQRIGFLLQEKEMLQQHNESLQRERAAFQEQCQALLPERDWLKQKTESLERERTAFQEAITASNKVAAEKAADFASLNARLKEAIGDADYALANQVRIQAALSVAKADLEGQELLRATLLEREKALAKAEMCVGQAMSRIEQMRQAYAGWRDEIMSDIAAMAGELVAERRVPPGHEPPLLRALAEAGADQEQVRAALTATRERLKVIEFEWEKTRRVLAIQTAEMDALRYAAASQVASANIQAGEMEHRIDTLETALSQVDAAAVVASGALPEQGAGIATLRAALGHLQEELRALRQARSAHEGERQRAHDEMSLFDSEYFEALPSDFQGHQGEQRSPMLPGLDAGLMSALEGALAPKPAAAPADAGEDETP